MEDQLKIFAKELFMINAIKFGHFETKAGLITPVYCDLRVIVSYPKLLNTLTDLLIARYTEIKNTDIICGVPYTALPIATALSIRTSIPMVMRRKETKNYGTKKLVEGEFKQGSRCLIIEDVVSSGSSILETVKDLNEVGIKCSEAVVLLNREQGGNELLQSRGIKMHALFTLSQLMDYLKEQNCVDETNVREVKGYLKNIQTSEGIKIKPENG